MMLMLIFGFDISLANLNHAFVEQSSLFNFSMSLSWWSFLAFRIAFVTSFLIFLNLDQWYSLFSFLAVRWILFLLRISRLIPLWNHGVSDGRIVTTLFGMYLQAA